MAKTPPGGSSAALHPGRVAHWRGVSSEPRKKLLMWLQMPFSWITNLSRAPGMTQNSCYTGQKEQGKSRSSPSHTCCTYVHGCGGGDIGCSVCHSDVDSSTNVAEAITIGHAVATRRTLGACRTSTVYSSLIAILDAIRAVCCWRSCNTEDPELAERGKARLWPLSAGTAMQRQFHAVMCPGSVARWQA